VASVGRCRVSRGRSMEMDVRVRFSAMRMGVGMNPATKGAAQPPQADPHQHHADRPLRHRGKRGRWKQTAQEQREKTHEKNAAGMTDAPPKAGPPGARLLSHRQGCDRRHVVRPRYHMQAASYHSS